jgi:hypothetical protein
MALRILFPLILFFIINFSRAQIRFISDEVHGNIYKITFTCEEIGFEIISKKGKNVIKFPGHLDEGKPGSLVLPQKDIFIAIPPGTNPSANLIITEKEKLNLIPQVNPEVYLINDTTLGYRDVLPRPDAMQRSNFKLKGYLWIDGSYCAHLKVNLFSYDLTSGDLYKNKKFRVELSFKENLELPSAGKEKSVNEILLNQGSATGFLSGKEYFPIPSSDSWIDYTKTYLKFGIFKDGIFRIYPEDLNSFGLDVNQIDPKTFKVFLRGTEIPIYVSGEADGVFNTGDFIELAGTRNYGSNHREVNAFGTPYNEFLDRYSDTTVYWLSWGGSEGRRVDTILSSSGVPSQIIDYYDEFLHFEENPWFDFSTADLVRRMYPEWTENETWNWWTQDVGTRSFTFNISNLYPDKPAHAYVKFQSYAGDIVTNTHKVGLSINSDPAVYDSGLINQYEQKVLTASFNSGILHDGSNTLNVISYRTSASINSIFGDWYEIEYPRYLNAIGDSLKFEYRNLPGAVFANIQIANIQLSDSHSIYKFISDSSFIKVTNFINQSGVISFNDTLVNGTRYYLSPESKIQRPKFYYVKNFVNLRDANNQADYIVITHPRFIDKSSEYTQLINNDFGLSTKVVNVFDIYDEYNYGFVAPEPIRDFLKSTHNLWQEPKPQFLILIGDANYDYYGNVTKYRDLPYEENLVPSYGVPPSDAWYTIWDTTDALIQNMDVGRLPVTNEEEFNRYFNKLVNHISRPYDEINKKYLLFSGGKGDNINEIELLKSVNDSIEVMIKNPPVGGSPTHFYKTVNPKSDFGPYTSEQISRAISEGGNFISYVGHSGVQIWDNSIVDPAQLENNSNINPLITDFGCSTGRFAEPEIVSFSELFINGPEGQAINYIGNSSLGFFSTSTTFPIIFFRRLLTDSLTIGETHKLSKMDLLNRYGSSSAYKVFSYCNTLFGDPLVKLKIPPKVNFSVKPIDFIIISDNFNEKDDSVTIEVVYYNLGKAVEDSLDISFYQLYQDDTLNSYILNKKVPLYSDTIFLSLPIKDKPGEHRLVVELDHSDKFDEIDENDNTSDLSFIVPSVSVRFILSNKFYNSRLNGIKLLNSSISPNNTGDILLEIDHSDSFPAPVISMINPDTFYTSYTFQDLSQDERYYIRAKQNLPESEFSEVISFLNSEGEKFYLDDSISMTAQNSEQLNYSAQEGFTVADLLYKIEVFSAGFNDGRTALGIVNGANYMDLSDNIGHHVVVLNEETLAFESYRRFDLLFGGEDAIQNYSNMLDTIPENKVVLFAICDEGSLNLSQELKLKIKQFGSVLIDSVGWRDSWAMIGRKNSLPGSVPEKWGKAFSGITSIDTLIERNNDRGYFSTVDIGPSYEWDNLKVDDSTPGNSQIRYRIVEIKDDETIDTLSYLDITNNSSDLGFIDAATYPKIRILAELYSSSDRVSPQLTSLGINYIDLPELGTNYQVVSTTADTVLIGDDVGLKFYVYNAGESRADSFNVQVEVIYPDNSRETIFEETVSSLNSLSRKYFAVNFNTLNGSGNRVFNIKIDPANKVPELFEDNNFYQIPFYVKPDTSIPSLNITFDGVDIMDGDYISSRPEIKIELFDQSLLPINDPSAVSLFLNDVEVSPDSSVISYEYNPANPKVIVTYTPQLKSGEYTLRVFGKNSAGNVVDSSGVEKYFVVSEDTKILYVYSYPNPTSGETFFTFKLTQIPDELRIKIFTVAGRMIKEIVKSSSELNFDFNRIYWDGKDDDQNEIANGVYFYKVIISWDGKQQDVTQKLAVVR